MKKRVLSMMLVLCMVLGMMPVSAFAAETDNLCDHHTEHTADCGYAPAVEGSPCTHECGEECAEACTHVHDEACGYVEAAAEVPCGYVCEESHGGATRVIYVDESTFLASGYSHFYDANENLLTTTREEQEDGWVKYTMPADAKYYLTYDGHIGGGGGGDYPELPANADTYDPSSDIWSCSHPGYAEGNCRLCGEPCPGHTYDNACDDKCNVCSEIREVPDHVYDNACDPICNVCSLSRSVGDHVYDNDCDADCNVCSEVRDISGHIYEYGCDTHCYLCGALTRPDAKHESDKPACMDGMCLYGCGLEMPATAQHEWECYHEKAPDCGNQGEAFYRCTVCGNTYEEYSPVVGEHEYDNACDVECNVCYFVREGSGHVYDNACDAECNECGESRMVPDHVYDGAEDAECNECGFVRTVGPALITGMSITIDGVVYDSSNTSAEDPAVITPNTAFITITVHGTALQNCTTDHVVSYYSGSSEPILPDYLWRFEADGTGAYHYYSSASALSDFARNTTPYELQYSNNGSFNAANPAIGSGVYIVYDDSTGGEEDTTPAEIIGVSITVDGETHTSGNVTITPTSTITLTVTGTNLQNGTDDNRVNYADGFGQTVSRDYFEISEDGSTATCELSTGGFTNSSNFEITYYNNYTDVENRTEISTGIYLTYDDSTGGEEDTTPAQITGVSITVDDVTYTKGNVTITPETESIIVTVTGTNFANLSADNILDLGPGLTIFMNSFRWKIDSAANTATADFSDMNSEFGDHNGTEIMYSNDSNQNWTGTGIYLTYEKNVPDSTGKILVDMQDSYGDGWNGAAIEIYKNGSLEQTVTVDETSNTVFLDYDSTATYEFKWVKGSYDGECSFTIYVDGEEKLKVENAAVYENGETIWSLDDTGGEEGGDDPIEPSGPVITQQPTDSEAKLGENYCVEVIAQGEGLKYQWYFRNAGTDVWHKSGVTDNTYDDVMTTARAGREVYCVITDASGNSVTTDTATLIALKTAELAIIQQPNDSSAKLDEMFCVEVLAEGDGLKYQWYWRQIGDENWNLSGQRDNTYDDVMTSARHNREVYCVITDAWGDSVTTEIATITGTPTTTLAITRQPESQAVTIGDMFNVTFEAQGDGLKYQWYFRQAGTEVWYTSGQKDNSYDDVMTKARHNRELYCVVTDAWGNTVETDPIVVILATPRYELAITAQPENESVKMGEMFCVTVEAQGDELKYQWYWRNVGSENWNVSGQRDNTYDDVMTKARHNREVKCVITDMWGESVETEIATITAIPDQVLAIVAQPTDATAAMGENYCVTVEAQGDGLTYQWYFKNAGTDVWHVSGVKDNTYDDVMIESRAGRQVYCVITDIWGNTVTTETVTLVCTDIPQAIAKN